MHTAIPYHNRTTTDQLIWYFVVCNTVSIFFSLFFAVWYRSRMRFENYRYIIPYRTYLFNYILKLKETKIGAAKGKKKKKKKLTIKSLSSRSQISASLSLVTQLRRRSLSFSSLSGIILSVVTLSGTTLCVSPPFFTHRHSSVSISPLFHSLSLSICCVLSIFVLGFLLLLIFMRFFGSFLLVCREV